MDSDDKYNDDDNDNNNNNVNDNSDASIYRVVFYWSAPKSA